MPCGRAVRDGVLEEAEQREMIAVVERTMRGLFHQGASTSFAPEARSAARHMGLGGVSLFANISARVRAAVQDEFGTSVYPAGALFTRIWADHLVPDDGMDVAPGHEYANPHVDKANRASYDYSALLYLNSHCSWASAVAAARGTPADAAPRGSESARGGSEEEARCAYEGGMPEFDGGRFAWLGDEEDVVVEPRGGRLLLFTGGLENPHHGQRVLAGTRYVMGFWFTCHAELEYVDSDSEHPANEPTAKEPPANEVTARATADVRATARRAGARGEGAAVADATDEAASWALYERLVEQQARLRAQQPSYPPRPPPRRHGGRSADRSRQHAVDARGSEPQEPLPVDNDDALTAALEAYARDLKEYGSMR